MVAKIKVDIIEKADGSPVDLTGQSTTKAWVHFNGSGTVSGYASFNMSSLIDNGSGNYTVNLNNVMAGRNDYAANVTARMMLVSSYSTPSIGNGSTAGSVLVFYNYIGTVTDSSNLMMNLSGDLA